jgi:hypothetical protein
MSRVENLELDSVLCEDGINYDPEAQTEDIEDSSRPRGTDTRLLGSNLLREYL